MSVLFSRPLTVPTAAPSPEGFALYGTEGKLSHSFGRALPRRISDYVLRSHMALGLLRRRRGYDAIITGRYGEFFAALQGVLPLARKPHLLLDVEWPHRQGKPWRRWLSQRLHRAIARGAWKIQVFCEAEADNYAAHFGIDRNKFVWVPYCTDVTARDYPVAEEDYVFTGGWHHRDHATLLKAAGTLPMRFRVAAPLSRLSPRPLPENVECLNVVGRHDFWSSLARARLVVLSLEPGLMRYPGVITYVTALRLGKCVIVNDPHGAKSYIVNGRTGVLVAPQDPQALADAIRDLWAQDRRRSRLSLAARAHAAQNFSLARYWLDLEELTAPLAKCAG